MEWQFFKAWFFRKTLTDGTREHGLLMRRWVNRNWQYRLPSADERDEYRDLMAW